MNKQFFYYTTKRQKDGKKEQPEFIECQDSFNMDLVIRTISTPTGEFIVLLNDFHEMVTTKPDIDLKTNKFKGYKNLRETVQSEITLVGEDIQRFINLTTPK